MLLIHGLTANAHAFDGLVEAGLGAGFSVVSVDLRGRGLSDHPFLRYSTEEHAADVRALMEHLAAGPVHIVGHSFGGFLGAYLAAHHPANVASLIMLDAGVQMNRGIGEMLMPRLQMLDRVYPSWDAYLAAVKASPYIDHWEPAMESYYRADVKDVEDGVTPRPALANIMAASKGLGAVSWGPVLRRVEQPTLLVHAAGAYAAGEPLLWEHDAQETVALLPDGRYAAVCGNHQTMLYGAAAAEVVRAAQQFYTERGILPG